jgi:antitoxin component YwqK of YwqJK toxin-antitoxin module
MNKTQILLALVILSIFGVSATFLDLSEIIAKKSNPTETKRKVKHGEIRQYTKDDRLKTIVNYNQGIKHGTSFLYHDDGETILLEMPYINGKREGVSKKYYKDGALYASTSYQDDKLHGPRNIYYSNGQLKAVINYGYGSPGTGTVEYLLDGSQKEENKIIFTKKGSKYELSTAEECREIKFFIGKLIENIFFNPRDKNVKLLTKENGLYFIDTNVYTPSYLKYQDIICSCKSTQGNPTILKAKLVP